MSALLRRDRPRAGRGWNDRGRAGPATHQILAVLLLGLLLVAPVVLVVDPLTTSAVAGGPVAISLSVAVVVYSGVRLSLFCWRGRSHWASAFFWTFSYIWLGLASLAQVISGFNPMSTPLTASVQSTALVAILVGFVAFDVGAALASRRRDRPAPECVDRPWLLSRSRVLASSAVAVVVSPLLVAVLGGPETLFSSRQAVADHLFAASLYNSESHVVGGLVTVVANVVPFASLLGVLCLWQADRTLRRDPALVVAFVALLVVNVFLNNPVSNPRYWFFAMGIVVLLQLRILSRPAVKVGLVTVTVALAAVVFPYSDAFRTEQVGRQDTTRSDSRPVDFFIGKTDYGAVTDIGLAVRYVDRNGHTWGRQLLGAAGFWVPRTIWEGKPVNTAELLARDAELNNPNLDSPLWAEGFIDFGVAGVALVLLAFGLLAGRADIVIERGSVDARRTAQTWYPIALCFVGYESFLLRGSLLQAMAKIVFLVAILALLGGRGARVRSTGPSEAASAQDSTERV